MQSDFMLEFQRWISAIPPEDYLFLCVCLLPFLVVMGRRKGTKVGKKAVLDRVLFYLAPNVPLTVKMATEGTFCVAELGWGKTWLVYMRYLRACIRNGIGGVILAAKAEDFEAIRKIFEEEGALHLLTVLSPTSGNSVNWFEALESIAALGCVVEEIIGGLASLMEVEQRSGKKSGGEDSKFFKDHALALLGFIIAILRMAKVPINASDIYQFLVSLPTSAGQLKDEEWREKSFANWCMQTAYKQIQTEDDKKEYGSAAAYFYGELANLADRTRTAITSTCTSMLTKLLRGWMGRMWGTKSNVNMAEAFEGKWFYIDTSPLEYGEYGTASLVMGKHLFQRMVLRRKIEPTSMPVALLFDECQATFVTEDRDYQAICRSKLGMSFAATQNLTGMYAILGGDQSAESQVKSWIALMACKIFGTNSDLASNKYASELCGNSLQMLTSGNTQHGVNETAWDAVMGNSNFSCGWNEQLQPTVPPEVWVRLKKPEPPKYEAEAVVIMPRLQGIIGQHWMTTTFRPEK